MRTPTEECIQQGPVLQNSIGYLRYTRRISPLRPIISSIGSVSYGVTKELARILKPLVDNSSHHVNNTKEFADEIRNTKLEEGECITSYDVTALFTSVPVSRRGWNRTQISQIGPSWQLITSLSCWSSVENFFLFQDQLLSKQKEQPCSHL